MIAKSNQIWGWKKNLNLPEPFEEVKNKRVTIEHPINGELKSVTLIQSLFKAALISKCAEIEEGGTSVSWTDCHKGVAIGTKSNSDGSETIYVEKPSKNRGCIDLVKYNPVTGEINASFYDDITKKNEPYDFDKTDGTAIFLAMMSEFKDKIDKFDTIYSHLQEHIVFEKTDRVIEEIAALSELVYRNLSEASNVRCEITEEAQLKPINSLNIIDGTEGPSKGKVLYGDFKIFKVGAHGESSAAKTKKLDANLKKAASLPFVRTEKDFSLEEKAMIPEISKIHAVSEDERFIVSEIVETFDDPYNSIKTIMLLGQSSSGKSHLAETLAARMKRPYSAPLTCTPNMDETTLLGTTLPIIESKRDDLSKEDNKLLDKLYSASSEEETMHVMQYALGIPDPEIIVFDPEGAYEEITGQRIEKISSSEVVRLAQNKMSNKITQLAKNLPKGDGVRYKYYKSPLVKAIENGWMIEIQEFNVVKEAAMFTSLNNVFDKEANGILETPYGQVIRHPDFRAVYTANPDYAGCRDPHQSVIARSDMVVTMNNPSKDVMKERIKNRMEFDDDDLLDNVIETFTAINEKAQELSCNGEATLRELYRFAGAIKRGVDADNAVENYVINPITRDEDDKNDLLEVASATALLMR